VLDRLFLLPFFTFLFVDVKREPFRSCFDFETRDPAMINTWISDRTTSDVPGHTGGRSMIRRRPEFGWPSAALSPLSDLALLDRLLVFLAVLDRRPMCHDDRDEQGRRS
jgi:hypothetical protein